MPDIDYQALYEQVRHENERLRMGFVKMHYMPSSPFGHIDMEKVRQFVLKNYLLIIVGLAVLSFAQSYISMVIDFFWKSKGDNK